MALHTAFARFGRTALHHVESLHNIACILALPLLPARAHKNVPCFSQPVVQCLVADSVRTAASTQHLTATARFSMVVPQRLCFIIHSHTSQQCRWLFVECGGVCPSFVLSGPAKHYAPDTACCHATNACVPITLMSWSQSQWEPELQSTSVATALTHWKHVISCGDAVLFICVQLGL